MIPFKIPALVLAFCVFAMGCSVNGERPAGLLTEVESKVRQAQAMEAEDYAPLAMKEANRNLAEARNMIDEGEFASAKKSLQLALVDAEYALAKTEERQKKQAANEIQEGLNTLQREIK